MMRPLMDAILKEIVVCGKEFEEIGVWKDYKLRVIHCICIIFNVMVRYCYLKS